MEAAERGAPKAPLDARIARWAADEQGRLRPRRLILVIALGYVGFSVTYVPINLFSVGRDAHVLFLPGEERLPFLPILEYLYVLTYFVGVLLYFSVRDAATLQRLLRATVLSMVAAYTTYLTFPVYLERPALAVTSLHTWLLSIEYLDKPYNHFPSMHVVFNYLAVYAAQVARPARAGLLALAAAVSLSTLFVKQHYAADVIYGFALATIAWRVARPRGAQ